MNLLQDKTILILGLGLIGGSIARGIRERGLCRRVIAHGRDESLLHAALLDGNIQAYSTDLSSLVPEADLILIAVPTLSVRKALEQLAPLINDRVIISDAASAKGSVVADARAVLGNKIHQFVPGHPIAGSEKSGYQASRGDLYQQRKVILTPLVENDALSVRTVMQLWQGLGAEVHAMSVDRHDAVLAGTSHLPHLLAFALINTLVDHVSEPDRAQQVFDYAAGGFADFSRIASSDPLMWRDIFLSNSVATVDALDAFIKMLQGMRQLIIQADGDQIQNELLRARDVREEFIQRFNSGSSAMPLAVRNLSALTACPGRLLRGTFRGPATAELAAQVLDYSSLTDITGRFEGFPEDPATLSRIKQLRDQGVPVIGPENGHVVIYGQAHESAQLTGPAAGNLPVSEILSACIMLGAAAVPGSLITVRFVEWFPESKESINPIVANEEQGSFHSAEFLQSLGARIRVVARHAVGWTSADLEISSSNLIAGDFDLSQTDWTDDQILWLVSACLLSRGQSRLLLPENRKHTLLSRCAGWQDLGAMVRDSAANEILVVGSQLRSGKVNCAGDKILSLLSIVLAQRATGPIEICDPGDVCGEFPGLLAQLDTLGFGLTVVSGRKEQ
jgi:prephenate dehydrogenase